MTKSKYLFDTHALFYWVEATAEVTEKFIEFFDNQSKVGEVLFSSVSIWEIALLMKKKKIFIENLPGWQGSILELTNTIMIEPTVTDMIDSTLLPDHHKDPFDRLLIAQALNNGATLVTRDRIISLYEVETFWI